MLEFKIFSHRICLTFGFFFILAMSSLRGNSLGVMSLALCLAHEAGHLFAMLILKVRLSEIRFYGGGIKITADGLSELKKPSQALIYLAGPTVNLAIAAFAAGSVRSVSLALAILNLLPISYFDGGKLLSLFLPQNAAKAVSYIAGGLIFLLSLYFSFQTPLLLTPSAIVTLFFIAFSYFLDS